MDYKSIVIQIIVNSGESKNLAMKALKLAKEGDYENAYICLEKSEEASLLAHKAQTELIKEDVTGEGVELNLLIIHAQDHLMTSLLARELIEEMVSMQRQISELG